MLKEEKEDSVAPELTELATAMPENTEADVDGEELDSSDMSAIIYEIPKEPEKRRRSKRSRVMDADGLLEMFHCPYEGCSQVYVALSSFQVRLPLAGLLLSPAGLGHMAVCGSAGCQWHRACIREPISSWLALLDIWLSQPCPSL